MLTHVLAHTCQALMAQMYLVNVKRLGQVTGHAFCASDAEELLGMVENSSHFERGGFLEGAQHVVVGCSCPLQDGMVFVWHPPLRGE